MSIPHLFRCPISLDIFTDPVTLCTGQTYDRPCIERWFATGHRTCPVTMQPVGFDAVLVPNRTLRHLIERWLSTAPDHHHPEPATTISAAAADAEEPSLAALKQCLESDTDGNGNDDAKVGALKKVMALAAESDVGRACLLQLGFLSVLLQLVFEAPRSHSEWHSEVVELALECALSLMPSNAAAAQLDCLNVLKKDVHLASFMRLMEQGHGRVKASLCRLLETIATAVATRDLAITMAVSPRVWRALLTLVHNRAETRALEAAVHAVAAVCSSEPACTSAVQNGAVAALIRHLSWASAKCSAVPRALATVEALVATEAGRKALARADGAMKVMVRHVFMMSSSNDGSEHAVGALLAACGASSRAARSEAVAAGVVTQLLFLLQSQCGARAKAKARALLKLLRCK